MFTKINDPDKPGDYLVIANRDFDKAVHTVFGEASAPMADEAPAAPAEPDAPEAKPAKPRGGRNAGK